MPTLKEDIRVALETPGKDTAARRRARRQVNIIVREIMIGILLDYAQQLREEIRTGGLYGGSSLTGSLVAGIQARNIQTESKNRRVPRIRIPERVFFLSSGTNQERPPIEKRSSTVGPYGLLDWVKKRGLTSAKYNSPKELAHAIAVSIGQKGVAAQGFRESAIGIGGGESVSNEVQQQFQQEMQINFGSQWKKVLDNLFTLQIDWRTFGEDF